MFSIFDVILIILLVCFALFGFMFGLIYTFGSLVGTVFGAWIAGHYFLPISQWITQLTGLSGNYVKVIVFILLFILINRLIGLAFYLINKIFHLISVIAVFKILNKAAGAILGLLEGSLVLGLSLYILSKYSFSIWVDNSIKASQLAPMLIKIARILLPFIPAMIKAVKGII